MVESDNLSCLSVRLYPGSQFLAFHQRRETQKKIESLVFLFKEFGLNRGLIAILCQKELGGLDGTFSLGCSGMPD
jgi:hypothetical protein